MFTKKLEDIYARDPELHEAKKKAVDKAISAHRESKFGFAQSEISGTAVDPEYEKTDGKRGD
ncbi:hypothetical protein NX059_007386 [Plenodomus lindquistii]|nr:hypothetical protein NX059_007386 [Plenodomus lindquistii]